MASREYRHFDHREPDDHTAAVEAFRRLYLFAIDKNDRALAALAILKALQKLENEAESDGGLGPLVLPPWVRGGLWKALAELLGKKTNRHRSEHFSQSMDRIGISYRRWTRVKKYLLEKGGTVHAATAALGVSIGDSQASLLRGYDRIEELIKEANEFGAFEDGRELQLIEARDLIPTQRLEVILEQWQ